MIYFLRRSFRKALLPRQGGGGGVLCASPGSANNTIDEKVFEIHVRTKTMMKVLFSKLLHSGKLGIRFIIRGQRIILNSWLLGLWIKLVLYTY